MGMLSDLLLRRYLVDSPVFDDLEDGLRDLAWDFISILDDFVISILDPTADSCNEERITAEYGDIIGVDRMLYKHYGVYLGDQAVIHYAPIHDGFMEKSTIHQTNLKGFLGGASSCFICKFPDTYGKPAENKLDSATSESVYAPQWASFFEYLKIEKYNLYSPEETVERAISRLYETSYNLAFNNCEHFAIWCKTGISESHQVNEILSFIPLLKAAV